LIDKINKAILNINAFDSDNNQIIIKDIYKNIELTVNGKIN